MHVTPGKYLWKSPFEKLYPETVTNICGSPHWQFQQGCTNWVAIQLLRSVTHRQVYLSMQFIFFYFIYIYMYSFLALP